MGIRISGPEVVAFLEWIRTSYPDETSFASMDRHGSLGALAEEFAAIHLGADDYRFRRRHWRYEPWSDERWRHDRPMRSREIARDVEMATSNSDLLFGRRGRTHDLLERYLKIPFRALFLYTTENDEFRNHLRNHWQTWSDLSGDLFDFYDYAIGARDGLSYSFSADYIRRLSIIPGCDLRTIRAIGLPCMLIWTDTDNVLIPFHSTMGSANDIRDRFRMISAALETGQIDSLRTAFSGDVASALRAREDVFISYRHSDREKVRQLHDAIEDQGMSAWYDEHLRAGDRFDIRIMHFLSNSSATVVAWSREALKSKWVLAEALVGHSSERLVPVALENGLTPPPPFNAVQTADLSDWPKDGSGFARMLDGLRALKSRGTW